MWVLKLNDMRAHYENFEIVAWAETKIDLENFVNRERIETYIDEGINFFAVNQTRLYTKCFKKGGPLEWYNSPESDSRENYHDLGTEEEFVKSGAEEYREIYEDIKQTYPEAYDYQN